MEKNKISIIIPAYNAEKYLPPCLDSIIEQSYKNLEIIVINDGSTDNTGVILDEYAKKDNRIININISSSGVTNARNIGLDIATGDYVGFCDADDRLEKDMYEFLMDIIQTYKVSLAHCGYNHITGNEVLAVKGTGNLYIQNKEEALKSLLFGGLFTGSLCTKLYRADLVTAIRIDPQIRINEDILMNYYLMKKVNKSVFVDVPKYNYITREDTGACLNTNFVKKAEDGLKVSQIIYEDLKEGRSILAEPAYERIILAYIDLYRCILFSQDKKDKNRLHQIRMLLWDNYKKGKVKTRKNKITILLFKWIPFLYPLLFTVYDKIRVKNIDV